MSSYLDASNYKLGLQPTQLLSLRDMDIAVPDQVIYRPSSNAYVRSDFSRVRDGFVSTDWIWDMISIARLATLLEFFGIEETVDIYVYTDKRTGMYSNPKISFALFTATMWKPILSGEEGVNVAQSPYVMQTVKIQFVNMVEVSGYYIT